jgi:hypothetical protein
VTKIKFDFVLGDVEELLKETNFRLENIEKLLEFILIPPDMKKYALDKKKRMKKRNINADSLNRY